MGSIPIRTANIMEIKCAACKRNLGNVDSGKIEKGTEHLCLSCVNVIVKKLQDAEEIINILYSIRVLQNNLN